MQRTPSDGEVASESGTEHERSLWPDVDGQGHVIFLLDAASGFEKTLMRDWIEAARPADFRPEQIEILEIPCARRKHGRVDSRLEPLLAAGSDPIRLPAPTCAGAPAGGREPERASFAREYDSSPQARS